MIWAAFTLAFFAFLHCGEFTYPGVHSFSSRPQIVLLFILVWLARSACLPLLSPLRLTSLDKVDRSLLHVVPPCCAPVSTMQQYFLVAQPPPGPLFSFRSGSLLTRSSVTHLLRDSARCAGLPYESLKGHSFRISAASTAAAAGLPDWLLKVLGRWSSDCYQIYICTP